MGTGHDSIAVPELSDTVADRADNASDLPARGFGSGQPMPADAREQLAPVERAGARANHDFAAPGLRDWHVPEFKRGLSALGPDPAGFHGAVSGQWMVGGAAT